MQYFCFPFQLAMFFTKRVRQELQQNHTEMGPAVVCASVLLDACRKLNDVNMAEVTNQLEEFVNSHQDYVNTNVAITSKEHKQNSKRVVFHESCSDMKSNSEKGEEHYDSDTDELEQLNSGNINDSEVISGLSEGSPSSSSSLLANSADGFDRHRNVEKKSLKHQGLCENGSSTGTSHICVCTLCNKEFEESHSLEKHMDTHKEETEKCPICGRLFERPYHVVVHMMRMHKDVKLYHCKVCLQTIQHPKNIASHVRTHLAGEQKGALILPKSLPSAVVQEDGTKIFKCDICDKTLTRKAGFYRHMLIHSGEKPFGCTECDRKFRTGDKLRLHRERVHATKVSEYKCDKCSFRFCDKDRYERHIKQCKGKKLTCDVCGKKFSYQAELKRHAVSHSNTQAYECTECPCRFKHVQNLKTHILLKHQDVDKITRPSVCDHCGKVLKNRNSLRKHLLTHKDEKPFKCPHCPKSYTQSAGLEVHMRNHTGEKPYQCEICSEMFVVKCNLDRHIQRHVGDKPHKCDQCSKAFVQITDLKRHMTVHSGEKKFPCRFCGKGFALKKSVPVHERTHTGEKPFACSTCKKAFTTRSDLKRHEKTHLKEKRALQLQQGMGGANAAGTKGDKTVGTGMIGFMESYPPLERMGFPHFPNRNEMHPQPHTGQFMSAFSGGIGYY